MIKGIDHVSLLAPNFEEAINFYKEAFGAKELDRFQVYCRACWLTIGDDILEIFEDEREGDGHFEHIGLTSTDVDADFKAALAAGGTADMEPQDMDLSTEPPTPARIAFVRGLAGERIELFQKR